ncbi:MAG: hypothetical protein IT428_06710 [Planctomycetaceae bacterium]|nr:hypothetical protein [Planctomycetaceae bacterium]
MTTTLSIPPRLIKQFQAEERERQDAERRDLVAELTQLDADEPAVIRQHTDAVETARATRDRLKSEYETAERAYLEAEQARRAALYPFSCRRDAIRATLSTELRHHAVLEGLGHVADLRDRIRSLPTPAGDSQRADADEYRRRSRVLAWCGEATAQLTALDSQDVDHVKAVRRILESEPR